MDLALQALWSDRHCRHPLDVVGLRGTVSGIEQGIEHLTVMDLSRRDGIALDQCGRGIGVDGVFVAIVGLVILFGPAGAQVFLPALGGLPGVIPTFGNLTRFDRGVFFPSIPLARGFDKACPEPVEGVASIICPALAT